MHVPCTTTRPNAIEFKRLSTALCGHDSASLTEVSTALAGPVVLAKGAVDRITQHGVSTILECAEPGSPRRPGGLGDFLAGSVAVLVAWARLREQSPLVACQAACAVVRRACSSAYNVKHRALVAPDVVDHVGAAFHALFSETDTN